MQKKKSRQENLDMDLGDLGNIGDLNDLKVKKVESNYVDSDDQDEIYNN